MKRWFPVMIALLAFGAHAKGHNRADAQAVLSRFLSGGVPLNQFINRMEYLGEQGWATEELLEALHHASDERRRGALLEALAAIAPRSSEDAEKALVSNLGTDDVGVRLALVRGLGRMKSQRGTAPLSAMLRDSSPTARREAAKALGASGAKASGAAIDTALKTEDDLEAKLAMVLALGQLGDPKQVPVLEGFSKDLSESVRLAAAQALCALGAPSGLQVAKKLLASSEATERMQGVLLLEGVKPSIAGPLYKGVLEGTDHRARATAARILVQGGESKRLDWLLIESLKNEGETRLIYEDQLEKLHVSDEQRSEILKRAGLKR